MSSLCCGVARKIPVGFLMEETPELSTGPGASLQGEWARGEGVRRAVIHVARMTCVDVHVLKSLDVGSAPPWGPAAGSLGWQGASAGFGRRSW